MADESKARGLGRGLEALLGDAGLTPAPATPADPAPAADPAAGQPVRGVRDVPIEFLKANPHQPRRTFDESDLADLSESIRERGVLQPIIVRPVGDSGTEYQIVAGERRWRAAQRAQRHTVPVIVKDLTDSEVLEIALIENVQRADLNALEEAAGYNALMQRFKYTQDQLSKLIGKSRSHVANMTRLLTLPGTVQDMIKGGRLSAGHARALVGSDDAERLAKEIEAKGLNVRQTEALVRKAETGVTETRSSTTVTRRETAKAPAVEKDADTLALERNVSNMLGLTVTVDHDGAGGGTVQIQYATLEQLDDICRRLAQSAHS